MTRLTIMRARGTGVKYSIWVSCYRCLHEVPLLIYRSGDSFLKQMKKAVDMRTKQRDAFDKFNATFTEETVEKWDKMVSAWDADIKAPNPYNEPAAGKFHFVHRAILRTHYIHRYNHGRCQAGTCTRGRGRCSAWCPKCPRSDGKSIPRHGIRFGGATVRYVAQI